MRDPDPLARSRAGYGAVRPILASSVLHAAICRPASPANAALRNSTNISRSVPAFT